MIGKEGYIDALEELVEEYLEKHPNASHAEVETYAEGHAWERYQDNLADLSDLVNDTKKEFRI